MNMQELREAVLEAQQAGDWGRVVAIKGRIVYLRRKHAEAARARTAKEGEL